MTLLGTGSKLFVDGREVGTILGVDVSPEPTKTVFGLWSPEVLRGIFTPIDPEGFSAFMERCFFGDDQPSRLRYWRGLVPKRKWRRWRGKRNAPPFVIDFDPAPRRILTPFISPLKDH